MRSAPTLKIWITPFASVAILAKLALLKIARCRAPAFSSTSSASALVVAPIGFMRACYGLSPGRSVRYRTPHVSHNRATFERIPAMTRRLAHLVLTAALAALVFAPAVPALAQSAAPATDDLAPSRDSPRATPAGTTFTAPAGWSMRAAPNMLVLNSPEGDSHIAIVDVDAPDA